MSTSQKLAETVAAVRQALAEKLRHALTDDVLENISADVSAYSRDSGRLPIARQTAVDALLPALLAAVEGAQEGHFARMTEALNCKSAASWDELVEVAQMLQRVQEPTEQPEPRGRLVLNGYGRLCYDAGRDTGEREAREKLAAAVEGAQSQATCATCKHKDPHKAFYCKRGIGILYPSPDKASMALHPKDSFGCTLYEPLPPAARQEGETR